MIYEWLPTDDDISKGIICGIILFLLFVGGIFCGVAILNYLVYHYEWGDLFDKGALIGVSVSNFIYFIAAGILIGMFWNKKKFL